MNATALAFEAAHLAELVPPATLSEARAFRDDLSRLLRSERAAAADFLVALADFDRRRGWERLGHASLFAFLTRELGLSNGAAYARSSAARLLPRFPEVEAALQDGRLCLSAVGELARVLTSENRADVLPRFFGRSSREAREVAAALVPRAEAPRRDLVTPLGRVEHAPALLALALAAASPGRSAEVGVDLVARPQAAAGPQPLRLRAHEVAPTHPARALPLDDAEPLDADLRRLHVTVSRRLLEKLDRARDGLSHALPCATTEQVLEAALDLLLERQARAKALVKRPGRVRASTLTSTSTSTLTSTLTSTATPTPTPTATATPTPTPTAAAGPSDPRAVPAAVEREVRLRDGDRCAVPLDVGGVCGSTWQVELDHVVPVALGGQATIANLRCACRRHNRLAAEHALGARARDRRGGGRPGGGAL